MRIKDVTLPAGRRVDIRIEDGQIDAIGRHLDGDVTIDAGGRQVTPGAVDVHVHFREPGAAHKETWASGTKAAAAGGVTTVVDQPNTSPPTATAAAVDEKRAIADGAAHVDFALNGGVVAGSDPTEVLDAPIAALGEVFMADSTGEYGIDTAAFESALAAAARTGTLVTVHAEDERYFDESVRGRDEAQAWSDFRRPAAEVNAASRACALADRVGTRVHIAHASTPGAIDRAVAAGATCEVTPHHLLLSTADLESLGTEGRMNPPLRDESVRRGVYERVRSGAVTMIATDHAPHTVSEKDTDIWSAPSGVPGVETMLPLLLVEAAEGRLDFDDIARLTARAPARRFGFARKGTIAPGMDADLVVFDPDRRREIVGSDLETACGWTPFAGFEGIFPELVLLRGEVAYRSPASEVDVSDVTDGRFGPPRGRDVVTHSAD